MKQKKPASILKSAVWTEQLSYLSAMGVPACITNIIIALIISYVYWQRQPLLALSLSSIVIGIILLRYIFFYRFNRIKPEQRDLAYWLKLNHIGALLSGLTWGIGMAMLANYLGGIDFLMILMATVIISSTGFISFASELRSLFLFFYPLVLPITLSCFYNYTASLMLAAGIMLVIYMTMASYLAIYNNQRFLKGVIYHHRHLELKKKLQHSNMDLRCANTKLAELSATDALTGIANRRYFNEFFKREFQQSLRENSPLSIIMIDVDFFKNYNDLYGHLSGDKALIQVAETLQQLLVRPVDLIARFGGEEFVVVMPCTDITGAMNIAERIQYKMQNLNLKHDESDLDCKRLTLSMGLTCIQHHKDKTMDDILNRADKVLYQAKQNGRNRYCIAEEAD